METLHLLNRIITVFFFACYSYQIFYILVALVSRPRRPDTAPAHRYAVLISARNEERVIARLLESLAAQTYDMTLVTVFVLADNCTDGTAALARSMGAVVYERSDACRVGKGYALHDLLRHILRDYPQDAFDGYLVFDADNVLAPAYIEEMNRTFSQGCNIITGYRNSKNYADNWISAGYALWFLRESRYLNQARMQLGHSCNISGTGFLFSREVLRRMGGWNFFLLTEDIEFSAANILAGERIAYCPGAELYDEQPVKFSQSWAQRMRWAKGYLQVFRKYGTRLFLRACRGSFSCYDMTMTIMPAVLVSTAGVLVNGAGLVLSLLEYGSAAAVLPVCLHMLMSLYVTLYVVGLITTLTEWRHIHTHWWKKLLYTFTFPVFMLTYIPIALTAVFKRVTWQPIEHTRAKDLNHILTGG